MIKSTPNNNENKLTLKYQNKFNDYVNNLEMKKSTSKILIGKTEDNYEFGDGQMKQTKSNKSLMDVSQDIGDQSKPVHNQVKDKIKSNKSRLNNSDMMSKSDKKEKGMGGSRKVINLIRNNASDIRNRVGGAGGCTDLADQFKRKFNPTTSDLHNEYLADKPEDLDLNAFEKYQNNMLRSKNMHADPNRKVHKKIVVKDNIFDPNNKDQDEVVKNQINSKVAEAINNTQINTCKNNFNNNSNNELGNVIANNIMPNKPKIVLKSFNKKKNIDQHYDALSKGDKKEKKDDSDQNEQKININSSLTNELTQNNLKMQDYKPINLNMDDANKENLKEYMNTDNLVVTDFEQNKQQNVMKDVNFKEFKNETILHKNMNDLNKYECEQVDEPENDQIKMKMFRKEEYTEVTKIVKMDVNSPQNYSNQEQFTNHEQENERDNLNPNSNRWAENEKVNSLVNIDEDPKEIVNTHEHRNKINRLKTDLISRENNRDNLTHSNEHSKERNNLDPQEIQENSNMNHMRKPEQEREEVQQAQPQPQEKQQVKVTPVGMPNQVGVETIIASISNADQVRLQFIMCPGNKHKLTQCSITREKSWLQGSTFKMALSDTGDFVLCAKKLRASTNYYHISLYENVQDKMKGQVGKVRSNISGDNYVFQTPGDAPEKNKNEHFVRDELGAMLQESGRLTDSICPRKLCCLLPMLDARARHQQFKPKDSDSLIISKSHRNEAEHMQTFKNKEPYWNQKLKAYVLNFMGRVQEPSIKNFQLCLNDDPDEDVKLQFGKVDENCQNLDFKYPFSAFQAFCVCLSSFDKKFQD